MVVTVILYHLKVVFLGFYITLTQSLESSNTRPTWEMLERGLLDALAQHLQGAACQSEQ